MDLIIVGAGIAGLHVATRYLQSNPSHQVLLIERNSYLGGRIYTHHQTIPGKGAYQWEAGAGRIPTSHKRIIGLIKEYGLTFQKWEAPPNLKDPFPDLIPAYLEPLQSLPASVLAENTLAEILREIHGPSATDFIKLFPYWAEFHTLRADLALEAFLWGPLGGQGGKAGHGPASRSTAGVGWGGCAEGLSALVERMGADVEARGGEIRLGTSVVAISPLGEKSLNDGKGFQVLLESNGKRYTVEAKKVVLALDVSSLRHIKGVQGLPVLRYLKQEPLLRTYAVFPVRGGKSWFSGMAKEVVPGPIRFFIPMAAEKGLAMISYTEGRDAMKWMGIKSVKEREKATMKALRELYHDKEIPDPLAIKFHGWERGCTYWLPSQKGREYDAEEESEKSLEPLRGLYLCSESFAVQQSWMESALVQADRVLTKLLS